MIEILKEPKNALTKQYQALFNLKHDIDPLTRRWMLSLRSDSA